MKPPKQNRQTSFALPLILAAAAGFALWQIVDAQSGPGEKTILFYQDSMHPWIKSDKPGKCTICAMDLTPIYQADQGFGGGKDMVVLSSNSITVLNVQTDEVKKRSLHRMLRVAGNLEAANNRKTILAAPAPGRIDNVAVESAGVNVKQGQALATFYSPDLTFQTRRYIFRDRLTEMSGQSGAMNMSGVSGASSRHVPTSGLSKNQPLPAAERAEADPFYNDLLSTLSGTVTERNVFNGQYVAEGDRLFTIVDLSVLWFRFDVYEQQLPWLRVGQKLLVTVPSVPGQEFPAVISVIEPTLNEATRTIKVRADVENPLTGPEGSQRRLLHLGMYAEARVRAEVPDLLAVPRSAVLFPGGSAYAYVDKGGGAFAMRRVQLGRQGDDHWEIVSGLDEGERVVTSGNVLIDAQAQFNQGIESGSEDEVAGGMSTEQDGESSSGHDDCESGTSGSGPSLTDAQRQAASDFLVAANAVSVALAADKLEQLKQHTANLPSSAEVLAKEFSEHPWKAPVKEIAEHSKWGTVANLDTARKSFLPFSTAVVEFVQILRSGDVEFASAKVYQCPMAPPPGLWYQAKAPLRNPYYGAKMLMCGEEVAPIKPLAVKKAPKPTLAAPQEPATKMKPDSEDDLPHSPMTQALGHMDPPRATPSISSRTEASSHPLARSTGVSQKMQAPSPATSPPKLALATKGGSTADAVGAANRTRAAGSTPPAASEPPATNKQEVLERFVAVVDGISQALAADDLARYHQAVALLPARVAAMQKEYPAPHRWHLLLDRVRLISQGTPPNDLESARKRFLLFSTNTAEMAKQLRKEEKAFADLKIYQCSMAPAPGTWMQSKPPLRNPFFGSQMLTCGEEVSP